MTNSKAYPATRQTDEQISALGSEIEHDFEAGQLAEFVKMFKGNSDSRLDTLASFAYYRLQARRDRLDGRIAMAMTWESLADRYCQSLPVSCRW